MNNVGAESWLVGIFFPRACKNAELRLWTLILSVNKLERIRPGPCTEDPAEHCQYKLSMRQLLVFRKHSHWDARQITKRMTFLSSCSSFCERLRKSIDENCFDLNNTGKMSATISWVSGWKAGKWPAVQWPLAGLWLVYYSVSIDQKAETKIYIFFKLINKTLRQVAVKCVVL